MHYIQSPRPSFTGRLAAWWASYAEQPFAVGSRVYVEKIKGAEPASGFMGADGVVVSVGAKHCEVRVVFTPAFSSQTQFNVVTIKTTDLSHRIVPSSALGEESVVRIDGFVFGVGRKIMGFAAYPRGFHYGSINGADTTAPESSVEKALCAALMAADNGQAETSLRALINGEGGYAHGVDPQARESAIEALDQLQKLNTQEV